VIEIGTLTVRRMSHHDIELVRDIDQLAYSRPWSGATWRHELGDSERYHLVATRAGEIVGHAGVLFVADQAHVTTVAVAPADQGRGVATLLLLDLLDEAVTRGIGSARLEVRAAERRAQRIYSRIGFAPAGIRRRYYCDPVDDAVIMWLPDLDSARLAERLDPIRSAVLERSIDHG
jgi:ribosomal-protein-alanine N-acetyltransferase